MLTHVPSVLSCISWYQAVGSIMFDVHAAINRQRSYLASAAARLAIKVRSCSAGAQQGAAATQQRVVEQALAAELGQRKLSKAQYVSKAGTIFQQRRPIARILSKTA